jgi:AcrR family transcriptional regulator
VGVSDRKEREKAEMKARILGAARELFLSVGFEKTSIRNIADAIEYSPSTIYLYFKDKNELLWELHQEAFFALIHSFEPVFEIADPYEKLVAMGRQYLKYAFENPELYDLMFLMIAPIEALECRNDVWEDGHTALNMLILILTECQKQGHFKDLNIDNLAMMVWANVHGLATIYLKKRTLMFPEEERMPRLLGAYDMLVHSLKNL